ncbi:MAG: nucleotide exchange factor GrpE [Clostridia bacterium]|nr:nucleotide exchange factor GrpE [Clostridia bacterium]
MGSDMMNPDETLNEPTAPETPVEEGATDTAEEKKADDVKGSKKAKKENAELKEKLAAAETELAEQKDKYLRLLAEYDNFRRRSQKEKESIYSDAYGEALKALLPVADNLELAARYDQGDKVMEGVKMVLNQLHDALTKMGIEEIETETFDPNVHNAVMHVEDDAYGEGAVVEVFQKGYRKGDKIIRHAMVKVAN